MGYWVAVLCARVIFMAIGDWAVASGGWKSLRVGGICSLPVFDDCRNCVKYQAKQIFN